MPHHLISDVQEWINQIPIVPIYYLAKLQPRERTKKKKKIMSWFYQLDLKIISQFVEFFTVKVPVKD